MKLLSRMQTMLAFVALVGLVSNTLALDLGDAAPPIKVSEWIKGGPVPLDSTTRSNILVLDFWDSWVNQCRYTVPFLSNLQKRYRDRGVVVVGISSEPPERVKKFFPGLDSPVEYAMA